MGIFKIVQNHHGPPFFHADGDADGEEWYNFDLSVRAVSSHQHCLLGFQPIRKTELPEQKKRKLPLFQPMRKTSLPEQKKGQTDTFPANDTFLIKCDFIFLESVSVKR